jgi:hypothetical protein
MSNSTSTRAGPSAGASLIKINDISAAVVGAMHSAIFSANNKNIGSQAMTSFVISVVARLASENNLLSQMWSLGPDEKNQIFVAILGAVEAYSMRKGVARTVYTDVSIDLVSEHVLKILTDRGNDSIFNVSMGGNA